MDINMMHERWLLMNDIKIGDYIIVSENMCGETDYAGVHFMEVMNSTKGKKYQVLGINMKNTSYGDKLSRYRIRADDMEIWYSFNWIRKYDENKVYG